MCTHTSNLRVWVNIITMHSCDTSNEQYIPVSGAGQNGNDGTWMVKSHMLVQRISKEEEHTRAMVEECWNFPMMGWGTHYGHCSCLCKEILCMTS